MTRRAFLAIGSNLGDRLANLQLAVEAFGTEVVAVSPIYETDPVDSPFQQDDFLNGVIGLVTDRSAHELLKMAKHVEQVAQRRDTVRNGPRTLDVDVLIVEGETIDEPGLTVPHPRMWDRRFVLAPLADIAPELVSPAVLQASTGAVRRAHTLDVPMQVHHFVHELRQALDAARRAGKSVGFVPTMGALHDGHLSLVRRAKEENDVVVMSIFVNPLQFAPHEDFDKYPRPIEVDMERAKTAGVTHLFNPSVDEMYPGGSLATKVIVSGVTETLEGAMRPGHFDGVSTVVSKLFSIVGECSAYFGQKDWQQLEVVRQMADDLSLPVRVVGCPIVREVDGLALSSRNVYLDEQQRAAALSLSRALRAGVALFERGITNSTAVCAEMRKVLVAGTGVEAQYAAHVGPAMTQKDTVEPGDRLLVAAMVGKTRLIDNIEVP